MSVNRKDQELGAQVPIQGNLDEYREQTIDRLTSAYAASQISVEEFEIRAAGAQQAKSHLELENLLADLPVAAGQQKAAASARAEAPRTCAPGTRSIADRIDPRLEGGQSESLFCVMGDRRLQGDWLQGDSVNGFCLMGDIIIDLRDTALPPGPINLNVACVMGDITIIVPKGLPVKLSAVPIMGDVQLGRDVTRRIERDLPSVNITGAVIMGEIRVKAMD